MPATAATVCRVQWPHPAEIPDRPGCYRFLDPAGQVLYVGKAVSLRRRIGDYRAGRLHGQLAAVLERASSITFVVATSPVEALWLEASLIATHNPRFNLRLTRPEQLTYLAVTTGHPFPRVQVWRGPARPGVRRFGPHPEGARNLARVVSEVFGVRPCRDALLAQHQRLGRPCLLGETGGCAAPCVDPDGYRQRVDDAVEFLSGRTQPAIEQVSTRMQQAAAQRRFEVAAQWRDRLTMLQSYTADRTVADIAGHVAVMAEARDELGAVVVVLYLLDGVLSGTESVVVDWTALDPPPDPGQVAATVWCGLAPPRPDWLLLPETINLAPLTPRPPHDLEPGSPRRTASDLSPAADAGPGADAGPADDADAGAGSGPGAVVPSVGRLRLLAPRGLAHHRAIQVATDTAAAELRRLRHSRLGDPAVRAAAAVELAQALGMASPPWRLECLDVSHFGGEGVVGALSVLVDGQPRREHYRRWRLPAGNDDYAAMAALVARRVSPLVAPLDADDSGTPDVPGARRSPPGLRTAPDLLLIDGGPGQLAAACAALASAGVSLPVAALAKRLEELYLPGRDDPVRLPWGSPALLLVQRARDEAHHAAVSAQRRSRQLPQLLEGVPGLGPARRARLVAESGGAANLVGLGPHELRARFSWLPASVAREVAHRLAPWSSDRGADGAPDAARDITDDSSTG